MGIFFNYTSMQKIYLLLILSLFFSCKKDNSLALAENDPYALYKNIKDSNNINLLQNISKEANDYFLNSKIYDSVYNTFVENDENTLNDIEQVRYVDDNNYFYKRFVGDKGFLYQSINGKDNLVFDPKNISKKYNKPYYITYIKPSWNKKFVAVALGTEGTEEEILIVVDVNKKDYLGYELSNCIPSGYLGLSWLPDNSGFTYLSYPDGNPNSQTYRQNSNAVLHKIGDNPKNVKPIFGPKYLDSIHFDKIDKNIVEINNVSDKYLIAYKVTVEQNWKSYYASIDGLKSTLDWNVLSSIDDKAVTNNSYFIEDDYFYISSKNLSRLQLIKKNIKTKEEEVLFTPNSEETLHDFKHTSQGLFIATLKNGLEAKLYLLRENEKTINIELPVKSGGIKLSNLSFDKDFIKVDLTGWLTLKESYKINPKTLEFIPLNLTTVTGISKFKDFKVETQYVKSNDNQEIPLSIIYNPNTYKTKKPRPLIITAYGAYGDNSVPEFNSFYMSFVEMGGTIAIAHVRGGGEKGNDWYLGGKKETKSNSWRDFISCSEYLIENKFTNSENLFSYAYSAGAIVVGMSMIERPELYRGVILSSPLINPYRLEDEENVSDTNILEFGSKANPKERIHLFNMDAYFNLKKNVNYPGVFIFGGMKDTNIFPTYSLAFYKKIKDYSTSSEPILLDFDNDSGHSLSWDSYYVYFTKVMCFAFLNSPN